MGSFDIVFCADCKKLCDADYEGKKKVAEEAYSEYINYQARIKNAESQSRDFLKAHVINNIHKYLPYFYAMDRTRIRRGLRNKNLDKVIKVVKLDMSITEKKRIYKFKVRVGDGSIYLFYNVNGRVIFGGVL